MKTVSQRLWINGISGKMGLELQNLVARSRRWHLIGGTAEAELVDREAGTTETDWKRLPECLARADVLIDFSAPGANEELFKVLQENPIHNKAVLIGTTGLTPEQRNAWIQLALVRSFRLLQAPNTSLGILLMLKVSEQLAAVLSELDFDIEVLESHHRAKIDAPSGTALFLAEGVARSVDKHTIYGRKGQRHSSEIGIASLRGGSVYGEHEIRFLGEHEELLISHRALSRKLFAQGALLLADWVGSKTPGAWRLEDMTIEEMLALLRRIR